MRLSLLLDALTDKDYRVSDNLSASVREIEIETIHYRAQDVRPGGLFVAIKGFAADGHDYIETAFSNGAAAVVAQREVDVDGCVVTVADTRRAMGELSAGIYGNPADRLFMIGVTGTNGKTTSTYLIESMLLAAGMRAGVIGTINYRYGGETFPNPVTTPESVDLQRIMADMVKGGVTHLIMETSSHGIALERIRGCRYDMAVFTNLSQDHLDFHGTMTAYWECKQRLFTEYLTSENGMAVLNRDDRWGDQLAHRLTSGLLTVGRDAGCHIRPTAARYGLSGLEAEISTPEGTLQIHSPLVGRFNLDNILLAIGVGVALSLPIDRIQNGIERVEGVPGRLEAVKKDGNRHVFVDFAHTPDALENTLGALRDVSDGRIVAVFGCGGDRDKGKRSLMGEIGMRGSDLTIVTSDNPRSEDPMEIIHQVVEGVKKVSSHYYEAESLRKGFETSGYTVVSDRKAAIEMAIAISKPEDIILIAGKGHEPYQILADRTIDFNDAEIAAGALCG